MQLMENHNQRKLLVVPYTAKHQHLKTSAQKQKYLKQVLNLLTSSLHLLKEEKWDSSVVPEWERRCSCRSSFTMLQQNTEATQCSLVWESAYEREMTSITKCLSLALSTRPHSYSDK